MIISYIVADMASHFTTSPRLYYHPPHVSILLLTNTVTFTTSARPELRVKVTVLGLVQLTTTN
jgi:hypothetical protein